MQLKFFQILFKLLDAISPHLAGRLGVALFYAPRKFPAAKWEAAGIDQGTEHTLSFDNESLTATVWDGEGPAILLVHGWQGRRGQLAKIALNLAEKGFRVIAFDGPAHGSSAKKRTTLVEFSEAVDSAARQFGPIHGIVGHSFGAAAVAIAVQNGVEAKRIVLISCPYSLRHVVSSFARLVGLPSRSHERMYPIMEKLHRCPEARLSFENIGPDLKMPFLLIHDETDRYVPVTDGEKVLSTINRAELVRTNGLGHMRILQDEAVVQKVSRYISEPRLQSTLTA